MHGVRGEEPGVHLGRSGELGGVVVRRGGGVVGVGVAAEVERGGVEVDGRDHVEHHGHGRGLVRVERPRREGRERGAEPARAAQHPAGRAPQQKQHQDARQLQPRPEVHRHHPHQEDQGVRGREGLRLRPRVPLQDARVRVDRQVLLGKRELARGAADDAPQRQLGHRAEVRQAAAHHPALRRRARPHRDQRRGPAHHRRLDPREVLDERRHHRGVARRLAQLHAQDGDDQVHRLRPQGQPRRRDRLRQQPQEGQAHRHGRHQERLQRPGVRQVHQADQCH